MTPPTVAADTAESAEPEIEIVLDDTDGVLDLTDRRRYLLQVVFGVDVPPTVTDEVFTPSMTSDDD
jgi:hypothetical protein